MSPGACRALVSSLLTVLVSATGLLAGTLPAAARSEALDEVVLSSYEVDRANDRIDVSIVLNLTNTSQETIARGTTWGPIY